MNKLFIPFLFATIFLEGCGGSGGNTNPTPSTTSSSKSIEAIISSSSSSSSVSSPQNSSSSSSTTSKITLSSSSAASSLPFALTSNSFVTDGSIPIKYTCFSTEVSPHLKWEINSDAVKSFALIMEDKDAIAIVGYPYVHWDVYNIPGTVREIDEGATLRKMPTGSIEGANDDNLAKYSGPCPPIGTGTHHYYFALYALNTETLSVNRYKAIKRSEFEALYAGNIIQKVEIIGLFRP